VTRQSNLFVVPARVQTTRTLLRSRPVERSRRCVGITAGFRFRSERTATSTLVFDGTRTADRFVCAAGVVTTGGVGRAGAGGVEVVAGGVPRARVRPGRV
jgi:hypothetical protein